MMMPVHYLRWSFEPGESRLDADAYEEARTNNDKELEEADHSMVLDPPSSNEIPFNNLSPRSGNRN